MMEVAYLILVVSFGGFYAGMFWWQSATMRRKQASLLIPVTLGLTLGSAFGYALALLIVSQGASLPIGLSIIFVVTGAMGFSLEAMVWGLGVSRYFRKTAAARAEELARPLVHRLY